jgi:K+-sensing histidine kinase KdpD
VRADPEPAAAIAHNSDVLTRVRHHPQTNDYILAVVAGLAAEGLLAVTLYSQGTGGTILPMLFFVEAIVLGAVFGPGPGIAGAVVPVVAYLVAEWGRRAFDIGAEPADSLGLVFVTVLYLAMVFAFLAGMAGAIRNRYFRREIR